MIGCDHSATFWPLPDRYLASGRNLNNPLALSHSSCNSDDPPGEVPTSDKRGTGESCHRTGSWGDIQVPRIHNPSSRRDGVRSVPQGSPRPRISGARKAVHEGTGQRLRNMPRMPRGAGTATQLVRGGRRQGCYAGVSAQHTHSSGGMALCLPWNGAATAFA